MFVQQGTLPVGGRRTYRVFDAPKLSLDLDADVVEDDDG